MTNEEIRDQHPTGIRGLWKIYPNDLLWKGLRWPLVISTIVFACALITKLDSLTIVKSISEAVISVMPSLLGFLLGGYTILISFANNSLLQNLTKHTKNRKISVFQLLSCVFALTILAQSATLALALIARFTMLNTFDFPSMVWLSYAIPVLNYLFGYLLLVLLLYTIVSFKDIISNIFNLTQLFHLSLLQARLADEREKARNAQKDTPV